MNSGLSLARLSDRPSYQQIIDQVKQRIASGDWKPGRELPSIRGLSAELQVSVITVRRAYLELEREGIIITRQGLGSFVSDRVADLDTHLQEEELNRCLRRAVELAQQLGLGRRELEEALGRALREVNRSTA